MRFGSSFLFAVAVAVLGAPHATYAEDRYRTETYSLVLGDGWRAAPDGEEGVFYGLGRTCVFLVSGQKMSKEVTEAELLIVSGVAIPKGATMSRVDTGRLKGLNFLKTSGKDYAEFWLFGKGRIFLQATFACRSGDQFDDQESVRIMIRSLDAT